jgi:hypothetical protein
MLVRSRRECGASAVVSQVMSRHRDAGSSVQLERSIDELLSLYRDLVRTISATYT